jgi:asparagine synthase (glutamine-hydrolysing)
MRIILLNNKGKVWRKVGESYVKGFAFINDRLLSEQDILNEIIQSIEDDRLNECMIKLNGNFSIILQYRGSTFLFADKLKTYPLLYAKVNNEWIISDQAKAMMDAMPLYSPDSVAIKTYLALGYLHGNQTFLENCSIVPAGNYVKIQEEAFLHEYHRHICEKKIMPDKEIMQASVIALEDAIRRMTASIGERPVWIALSGGYDSRLLACVLKKMNIKNVKCYTYGINESYEVKISKRVAEILGFQWHCVEYTEDKVLTCLNDIIDKDFLMWSMNLNTTSHFQDLIAIKELVEKGIIKQNSVIISGHKVGILNEEKLPINLLRSRKSVADLIYYSYFYWNILKGNDKRKVLANLGITLNSTISNNDELLTCDLVSDWNIKYRQANFIINSVRCYEYYNLDWRIPMWDDEFARLWLSLDPRRNSKIECHLQKKYIKFIFDEYFYPNKVAFYKDVGKTRRFMSNIRLPLGIKDKIKLLTLNLKYFKGLYDFNGDSYITKHYLEKIKETSSDYIAIKKYESNALIALYTILSVEEYFRNR